MVVVILPMASATVGAAGLAVWVAGLALRVPGLPSWVAGLPPCRVSKEFHHLLENLII